MMAVRRFYVACRNLIKPNPEDKQTFLQLVRFKLLGAALYLIPVFDGVANAPP